MSRPVVTNEQQYIEEFDELMEIAFDLRWSWDQSADDIWRPGSRIVGPYAQSPTHPAIHCPRESRATIRR